MWGAFGAGQHVDFPLAQNAPGPEGQRKTPCGQQLIAARWRFQRPTITARPLKRARG